ncbi:MAG: stage II sporulation protein E, partial [Clostridiales bacterium]|nr:stage II sporulation protein E [Clostridiales bacterium]
MEKAMIKLSLPLKNTITLGKKEIIYFSMGIIGFFLGRVWLFNFFNPIAIGYLTVFLFGNFKFLFYSALVALGLYSSGSADFPKYAICISVMCIINFFLKKRPIVVSAMIGGLSLSLAGAVIGYLNNTGLYFLLAPLLEGLFTFCIALVLKKGANVLEGNVKKRLLAGEEIISTCIILGGVIAGASGVYIFDLSFRDFFSTLLILVTAYRGGVGLGALSGILVGLMLNLTRNGGTEIISILAVSGMVSGIYYNKNKLATGFLFVTSRMIMTYYIDKALLGAELGFSVASATICFLAVKDKFYFNFLPFLNSYSSFEDDYALKIKEVATDKLESFSKAFNKLAVTFKGISQKKTSLEQKDITAIIDDIASKVCVNCKTRDKCWKEDFFNTYQASFSILSAFEKRGEIKIDDIPVEFLNSCVNIAYFVETAANLSDLYKNNFNWQNKVAESRELIAEQYLGVSYIIKDLCEEINTNFIFKEDIEAKLISEFNLNKAPVESVIVMEGKNGRFEVFLNMYPCPDKANCTKDIIPIINRVTGRKVKCESVDCNNCRVKIIESQKFFINAAISKAVKDNSKESGDSYSFLELNNGQALLALSDGMGSGNKAKEESKAAIDLLEEFIESGFQKDLAIKIINSALVLKSNDESFSTLDVCIVDNYTGTAEFLKIGASSTFLLRGGEVQVIKSTTLPMGILNNIDVEMLVKKLKHNDIIIMIT